MISSPICVCLGKIAINGLTVIFASGASIYVFRKKIIYSFLLLSYSSNTWNPTRKMWLIFLEGTLLGCRILIGIATAFSLPFNQLNEHFDLNTQNGKSALSFPANLSHFVYFDCRFLIFSIHKCSNYNSIVMNKMPIRSFTLYISCHFISVCKWKHKIHRYLIIFTYTYTIETRFCWKKKKNNKPIYYNAHKHLHANWNWIWNNRHRMSATNIKNWSFIHNWIWLIIIKPFGIFLCVYCVVAQYVCCIFYSLSLSVFSLLFSFRSKHCATEWINRHDLVLVVGASRFLSYTLPSEEHLKITRKSETLFDVHSSRDQVFM